MEGGKNMKRKIVGILVCMLMIATVIPTVGSLKNSGIESQVTGHPFIGRRALSTLSNIESFKNNQIDAKIPTYPMADRGNWDWIEAQKITIPDGRQKYFGLDIAIDGDTALISAPADDNWNGSVFVYTRTGDTWTQQQKLTASDSGVVDCFGVRIALQGNTALIGADDEISQDDHGAVYVFTRTGTTWTEQQKLTSPDGDPFDLFCTPALDGDTALIAAQFDDDMGIDAGALYVFTRTGTTWTQQAKLYASDAMAGEWFGFEVSLDGDTAVTTTYNMWNDTVNPGAAYVFTRSGTTWTQQAKLVGLDTVPGDTFGYDVALDDDTILVGAVNDITEQGDYSGSAYVFTRTGTTWTQEAKLLHSNGTKWDWLGTSVSLEGDTALIGAANEEESGAEGTGAAYVFTRTGTTWTEQQRLIASDHGGQDNFGLPVYLNGNTAFIGAWYQPNLGAHSGTVYVFTKTNLTFSITGGLGVKLEITNKGIANVSDVPWQLHVEGGILGLINKTINGTINITAGETIPVGKMILFGFGLITITARVADEEQTATGTQLIIVSLVK
jgi:hypothetical protein